MKKILASVFFLLSIVPLIARQTDTLSADTVKYWKTGGTGTVTFSQSAFSSSWQGGGENNLSGLFLVNLFGNYSRDKSTWENILDVKYGAIKKGKDDLTKSDDKLELTSKYGYAASKSWYYSAMLNVKTQMTNGYDPEITDSLISGFLSPMYLVLSLGMDFKPSDVFSAHLSPLSTKVTVVNNSTLSDQGRYGVDPGSRMSAEFGATAKFMLKKEIMKNVLLQSNLQLFQAYKSGSATDVDWEVNIGMKINKLLTASLIGQLIYNQDEIDEVQWKEIFGLGLSYSF